MKLTNALCLILICNTFSLSAGKRKLYNTKKRQAERVIKLIQFSGKNKRWNRFILKKIDAIRKINIRINEEGETFLHQIIKNGRPDLADPLVDRGINLNLQTKTGQTALHYAAQARLEKLPQHLIRRGALNDIVDKHGNVPADYAPPYLKEKYTGTRRKIKRR